MNLSKEYISKDSETFDWIGCYQNYSKEGIKSPRKQRHWQTGDCNSYSGWQLLTNFKIQKCLLSQSVSEERFKNNLLSFFKNFTN